jgi:hypothetical protein
MKLKIAKTSLILKLASTLLILGLMLVYCARKTENVKTVSDRGSLESDFSGKIAAFLTRNDMTPGDSIKLAQYAYQLAALESEFYQLQNELIKSYFVACDEKCQTHKCSDGEIISAAMAYFLGGAADSAGALAGRLGDTKREFREITKVIAAASAGDEALGRLYVSGVVTTPLATAFLAIASLDRNAKPADWEAILKEIKSDLPEIQYARAYALALNCIQTSTGCHRIEAWQRLPDFAPLSKVYPEPSFTETIKTSEGPIIKKIYLPLGLYVRMQIDNLLLREILDRLDYPNFAYSIDIQVLKALSSIKNLGGIKPGWYPEAASNGNFQKSDQRQELLSSLRLAKASLSNSASSLDSLSHPISRAAYLKILADHHPTLSDIDKQIYAEIDSSRQHIIWESRILLSVAMIDAVGPEEAFRHMNNLGVSDLSVRNNSPEWLAIYARASLSEASQLSLATQLIYDLSQHYPYTIGLYELVQSYNHLCKYF